MYTVRSGDLESVHRLIKDGRNLDNFASVLYVRKFEHKMLFLISIDQYVFYFWVDQLSLVNIRIVLILIFIKIIVKVVTSTKYFLFIHKFHVKINVKYSCPFHLELLR